ncbi:dynamin family protein [Paenibacillus alvei]|uniref:dynamin family protein n=1 Tax=Paenibacillus alvei TaxID=44250 RepID=UPI001F5116BF|nr:dynamin family protein [Paenibacillus alvei]
MEKMNARLHTNSAIAEKDSGELGKWLKHTAEQMQHRGDVQHAEKMLELARKWQESIVMVTFCGHFSAGKSSVINALCGKQLLPSSPIPTSANVVTLRYGERHARVLRRLGDGSVQEEPVQFEQLDEVCRDGVGIERVVLFDEIEWMEQGVALLDTPGVDSTDAAHRAATEEAMHLADIVFYVTDYNHVQSETNFAFAKEVADAGKPLIWIVNQIDKHREQELTFESYQQDAKNALDAWQLKPEGVFYISVKQPEHPLNEWNALEAYVRQAAMERLPLVRYSIMRAACELIAAHAKLLKEPYVSKRKQFIEHIGDEAALMTWKDQVRQAEQRVAELTARQEEVNDLFQKQLQQLLANANVTPAAMRDQAQQYLESRKPGFKVGFLFSGAKTETERNQRLHALTSIWKDGLRANVEVHLIQMIRALAEEVGADGQEASSAMESALPDLGESWLAASVSEGASGSPEYTLNYCRSLADEARTLLRRAALTVAEPLLKIKLQQYRDDFLQAERELAEMKSLHLDYTELESSLQAIDQMEAELARQIELWLPTDKQQRGWNGLLPDVLSVKQQASSKQKIKGGHSVSQSMNNAECNSNAVNRLGSSAKAVKRSDKQAIVESWQELSDDDGNRASEKQDENAQADTSRYGLAKGLYEHGTTVSGSSQQPIENSAAPRQVRRRLTDTAGKLEQAAGVLEQLDSMRMLASEMRDKAKRLVENRFTVALFGAFSAGKSSFANALIGQNALPVSPNPTTAAINTIAAATDAHPHGTARVTMKREAKLLDDLRYALETLGEPSASTMEMEEALHALARIRPETIHPSGRPYYRFIQAVKRGIDKARGLLGQELMVDEAEYRLFVSDESRSAFVERIDLFIDSELTRQGFVFVDTPGADSINARHTGVAFEYMKQADIILFVTYYNHAFSQADRQFLTQLGRVKDAFELDKMFFVVNASDLAASPEELSSVLDYVEDRLREFGVRNPRLFPISSLQALEGKQQAQSEKIEKSGIEAFEQSFLQFAGNELSQLSIHSAQISLERAAKQLKAMWDASHADAAERERELLRYQNLVEQAHSSCSEWLKRDETSAFRQEADELLYHVSQRLQFRFGDMFSHAFNPASLRRDDRNIDSSLQRCYVEWSRIFTKELANELYATSLRMEQSAKKLVTSYRNRLQQTITEQLPGYSPTEEAMTAWPTPEVSGEISLPNVTTRWIRGYFRNSKAFFEGNGRSELRQALELQTMQAVKQATEAHRERFIKHMLTHYHQVVQKSYTELSEALDRYMERLSSALQADVDEGLLQAVMSAMEEVISADKVSNERDEFKQN